MDTPWSGVSYTLLYPGILYYGKLYHGTVYHSIVILCCTILYHIVPVSLDWTLQLNCLLKACEASRTHEPVRNMHGHFMGKASGTGAPGEDMELATMPGRDPLNPDKNTRPCDYITQES